MLAGGWSGTSHWESSVAPSSAFPLPLALGPLGNSNPCSLQKLLLCGLNSPDNLEVKQVTKISADGKQKSDYKKQTTTQLWKILLKRTDSYCNLGAEWKLNTRVDRDIPQLA